MTGRPLVTVIVRSHDYEAYLGAAIESALGQTYERTEVIVVDDGSTDGSRELAAGYGDRIRLLTQENAGVERASNRAAAEARGDYVAFLDADDVLEPTHVEQLLAALERSPDAAYAYCRPRLVGAREGLMRCLPFSAYFLVRRTNFVHPSALVARRDFLALGGYAEELRHHGLEDWDFWLTMLEHGKRGTYVREPLVRWRRHAAGSRNPETPDRLPAAVAVIRARHGDLVRRTRDRRGTLGYAIDLALAALDLAVGYSRFPRLLQAVERSSWRRWQRWHARPAPPPPGRAERRETPR